jgi:hypothetical protein
MSHYESPIREPLIQGENITYTKITDDIVGTTEKAPPLSWWIGFIMVSATFAGIRCFRYCLDNLARYWILGS